jgi:thiol-disulfide isomerase/thioredoxin
MVSLQAALIAMALSGTGAGQTVLLDFYADWCGPCRGMDPTVRELSNKGYPIRRVNIDQEQALARQFGVERIPCFVMVVDGREVDRYVGPTSLDKLERMCKQGPPRQGLLSRLGCGKSGPGTAAIPPTGRPALAAAPRLPAKAPATCALPNSVARGPVALPASAMPRADQGPPSDADLLAATVRLRVEDADGHSCGTGAVIDARDGEALILTCGHIFRDSKGKGRIDVDLFGPTPANRVPGRLIAYDLKRDVGLVTIRASGPIAVARVAPPGYPVRPGDSVASVGCNHGENPTVQHSQVTSLNKFLGPPNFQVAGQPVEGRSGGPLFSNDGLVIGVCNAADPSDREGLFAGLGSIQAHLDEVSLGVVYRSPPARSAPATALASTRPASAAPAAGGWQAPATLPRERFSAPDAEPARPAADETAGEAAGPARLAPGEQAALEEIHRHVKQGDEVVVISRNRDDPQGKSDVYVLDRASSAFMQQVKADARAKNAPYPTSMEVPRPRTPILEWDIREGYLHQGPVPVVHQCAK